MIPERRKIKLGQGERIVAMAPCPGTPYNSVEIIISMPALKGDMWPRCRKAYVMCYDDEASHLVGITFGCFLEAYRATRDQIEAFVDASPA
jgi:hypothetical protein